MKIGDTIKSQEAERGHRTIIEYAFKYKQLALHSYVKKPSIKIKIGEQELESVDAFRYLRFTWSSKIWLKLKVELS